MLTPGENLLLYKTTNVILGRKQLVLDPQLMRPMDRVAGMSVLKSAGVETVVKQAYNLIHLHCAFLSSF